MINNYLQKKIIRCVTDYINNIHFSISFLFFFKNQLYQEIQRLKHQLDEKNKSLYNEACQKISQLEQQLFLMTQKYSQSSSEVLIKLNILTNIRILLLFVVFKSNQLNQVNLKISQLEETATNTIKELENVMLSKDELIKNLLCENQKLADLNLNLSTQVLKYNCFKFFSTC